MSYDKICCIINRLIRPFNVKVTLAKHRFNIFTYNNMHTNETYHRWYNASVEENCIILNGRETLYHIHTLLHMFKLYHTYSMYNMAK